jgi:predicted MFS family arabinose efflux permease
MKLEAEVDVSPQAAQGATPASAWTGLALLWAVFTVNQIDRSALFVVVEPIKREFHLSDSAMGLLSGLGYAGVYALMAIPMGFLVDRVNRKRLLAALLSVWSLATLACGVAGNYVALLAARMLVGGAEAGASPTSSSIISDLFPPRRRATAVGIYFLGTPVAAVIASLVGAQVAATYGWRAIFLMAGLPGLILAPLVLLFLKHPKRGVHEEAPKAGATPQRASLARGFKELFGNPVLLCGFAAIALSTVVSSSFQTWSSSLLIREHGLTLAQQGRVMAICAGTGGLLSVLVSGPATDAFAKGNLRRLALFAAAILMAATACELIVVRATSMPVLMVGLGGFSLFQLAVLGPAYSIVLNTTSPANRGLILATQQLVVTLVGMGGGPWLSGALSDAFGGAHSISRALTALSPVLAAAAGSYLLAFWFMGRKKSPSPSWGGTGGEADRVGK